MTRGDVIERAAEIYARALADLATLPARAAAQAAAVPGGPSVADLTDRIERRQRDGLSDH